MCCGGLNHVAFYFFQCSRSQNFLTWCTGRYKWWLSVTARNIFTSFALLRNNSCEQCLVQCLIWCFFLAEGRMLSWESGTIEPDGGSNSGYRESGLEAWRFLPQVWHSLRDLLHHRSAAADRRRMPPRWREVLLRRRVWLLRLHVRRSRETWICRVRFLVIQLWVLAEPLSFPFDFTWLHVNVLKRSAQEGREVCRGWWRRTCSQENKNWSSRDCDSEEGWYLVRRWVLTLYTAFFLGYWKVLGIATASFSQKVRQFWCPVWAKEKEGVGHQQRDNEYFLQTRCTHKKHHFTVAWNESVPWFSFQTITYTDLKAATEVDWTSDDKAKALKKTPNTFFITRCTQICLLFVSPKPVPNLYWTLCGSLASQLLFVDKSLPRGALWQFQCCWSSERNSSATLTSRICRRTKLRWMFYGLNSCRRSGLPSTKCPTTSHSECKISCFSVYFATASGFTTSMSDQVHLK